jgi:peptidyl-prolyl cis-trans isomerase D
MLDSLRKTASGIVGFVIIGFLVIAFAVWGIADIFTGFSSNTVAEVGDEEIDSATFDREFRMEVTRFSERLGQPLTREQAIRFGVDRMTLSRLIAVAALDGATSELGLTFGDEAVGLAIVTDPALQGPFGRFDRDLFRQLLLQNGITEAAFVEQRRKAMTRDQLNNAVTAGIPTPSSLVSSILQYQNETRTAGYIILPPSLVGDVGEPEEEAITSLYEDGASAFTMPETRDFSVMEIEPSDLFDTISISDEQLQAAYNERRSQYDVPERREVMQITFPSEDAANAALARLRDGTTATVIADELGLKKEDISLGKVSRADMLAPDLAEAAFALESGAWSAPVRGPLGWSILHVEGIEAGVPSTFEGVKDELLASLKIEIARDQIYDIQNAIEDARAGGEPLADIAARYDTTVKRFTGVTRQGRTRDGATVELPDLPQLLDTVFDNMEGDQIPPLDSGKEGYYWVSVDAVTPAERRPLEEVRDEIVSLWKNRKRAAELEALAQRLADRGNAGESFDVLANELGRSVLTMPGIQRQAQNDTFSRIAVTKLFAAPEGGFTWGPVGVGDSILLMQVRDVRSPQTDETSGSYEQAKAALADSMGADLLQTLVMGYQQKLGVTVNQGLLQQLTASDSRL